MLKIQTDNESCADTLKLMNDSSKRIIGYFFFAVLIWNLLLFSAPVMTYSQLPILKFSGAFLYLLFDPVCHQLPERSFYFFDIPFPVCIRCTSIYLGSLFLLGFSFISGQFKTLPAKTLLLPAGFIFLEITLEKAGLYQNQPLLRILSGFLLGIILTRLLIEGLLFTNTLRGKTLENG